ncbi:hypothetical protein F4776DRAFT_599330 [Hypoxylon sp. NC0597]|nr:hypothetical protein F4776DRAFT_599330 [Hypoxylon sp. NC0597]
MASEADPETVNGIDTNTSENAASSPDDNADNVLDADENAEAHEADVNTQVNTTSDDAEPEPVPHNTGDDDVDQANIEPENADPKNAQPGDAQHDNSTPEPGTASVPPSLTPTPNPDLDKRLPLTYWLLCGGTGPPPKMRNFLRMTQERNTVARAREERTAARKQALKERKQYLEDWEKEWGSAGTTGLVMNLLAGNRRRV